MELGNLLQHDLLQFCKSSEDSDNSFDLDQLLSSAVDKYESQSGQKHLVLSQLPAPPPKADSLHRKQPKMFKKRGSREFQRRLSKTHATVSECGMNGGATGERLVVTTFQL